MGLTSRDKLCASGKLGPLPRFLSASLPAAQAPSSVWWKACYPGTVGACLVEPRQVVPGASVTTVANAEPGQARAAQTPLGCPSVHSLLPIGLAEGGKGRRISYGDCLAVCVLFLLNFLLLCMAREHYLL